MFQRKFFQGNLSKLFEELWTVPVDGPGHQEDPGARPLRSLITHSFYMGISSARLSAKSETICLGLESAESAKYGACKTSRFAGFGSISRQFVNMDGSINGPWFPVRHREEQKLWLTITHTTTAKRTINISTTTQDRAQAGFGPSWSSSPLSRSSHSARPVATVPRRQMQRPQQPHLQRKAQQRLQQQTTDASTTVRSGVLMGAVRFRFGRLLPRLLSYRFSDINLRKPFETREQAKCHRSFKRFRLSACTRTAERSRGSLREFSEHSQWAPLPVSWQRDTRLTWAHRPPCRFTPTSEAGAPPLFGGLRC